MSILQKIYSFLIDSLQTLLLAASVFLVIYLFFFRPFQVNGTSMYPKFEDREYILTNIISLQLGRPERGDVIVFKAPTDAEKDYIKRVIGVSGDDISIKDGQVYVNHQRVDQSFYLSSDVRTYGGSFLQEDKIVTVPPDSYFVMGDNREHSSDSREWGFVKRNAIIGKSFFVYWPLNRVRLVKNPYN